VVLAGIGADGLLRWRHHDEIAPIVVVEQPEPEPVQVGQPSSQPPTGSS
jgi:hypothetical protein